ncbi:CLUMA_CG013922, isoform A [Clunio marinus]|uniref:CLUMA_CG013922, isoform A n=1 Tax=Clunio marinus TaxID=568069 RepID=A0A1J1INJ3_9DIPT|nr:CLUMA_CG013922, isoform A [Clunio marinus]
MVLMGRAKGNLKPPTSVRTVPNALLKVLSNKLRRGEVENKNLVACMHENFDHNEMRKTFSFEENKICAISEN